MNTNGSTARYIAPDVATRRIVNPLIGILVRVGFSMRGARQLHVRKRVSGGTQVVPVNVLSLNGADFLVAPRGNTQWVRNLRAAGGASLRKGRRMDSFTFTEVANDDKLPILREYLRLWGFEVGKFFEGIDPKRATDQQLTAIAHGFPVFRLAF